VVLEEEFFLPRESGAWIRVWYGSESFGVDITSTTLGGHEFGIICIAVDLYKGGDFSSVSFIWD